jgi:hypothetical protein
VNQRLILAMIIVAVTLISVVSWGVRAQSTSRVTWEYKVISSYGPSLTNPPPNVQVLNEAGYDGWELVEIRSEEFPKVGSNQFRTDYYLKRVK